MLLFCFGSVSLQNIIGSDFKRFSFISNLSFYGEEIKETYLRSSVTFTSMRENYRSKSSLQGHSSIATRRSDFNCTILLTRGSIVLRTFPFMTV